MANAVFESPRQLEDAYALMADGLARPIAGATDALVQADGDLDAAHARIVDLWQLEELRGIAQQGDTLVIGALTTYTDIRRSPLIQETLPALAAAASTIGAAQIQNRGTLGGNIANASPAGDTLPILLAARASIDLGGTRGERSVSADAFWTGYRQTARQRDELILRVRFPILDGHRVWFRKVGTRRAQAISKVVMAAAWHPSTNGAWHDVRLALGSVAERPIRAIETERAIEGRRPSAALADQAAKVLIAEIRPIDDVRSTAAYRRAVAGGILHRLLSTT
ncbi:MAG TPA: FAD binding domain-containing protein [Candidatus Limnocylindrales bacterium]|nr:FAD binding domain-containing protein [Candidatus Limnocylindrales bacterium]